MAGLGRVVAYYPALAHALGGVNVALVLSQLFYLAGPELARNGYPEPEAEEAWVAVSAGELMRQTGLTRAEQEGARRHLRGLGVLNEERRGMPASLCFQVNWGRVDTLVGEWLNQNPDMVRAQRAAKRTARAQAKASETPPPPPLLSRMYEAFNEHYARAHSLPFTWGNGKHGTGKHWNALRQTAEAMRVKVATKTVTPPGTMPVPENVKAQLPLVSDDEIVNAYNVVLACLPEYYRTERFTPMEIYSHLDAIIQKITKQRKEANGQQPTHTGGATRPNLNAATDRTRYA